MRTGVASNTENGAVSADVPLAQELAAEVVAWLAGVPASWLCSDGEHRRAAARVLEALGCRPERAAREMRASLAATALGAPQPVGVHLGDVASERGLEAWLDVAGACGWHETKSERAAWRALLAGLAFAPDAPLRLYVAFRGDRAVGMASAFYGRELALLTANAVVPDERRRGIGRSLAALRLREARERGCETAVLAPTPDGARLYDSLGFETHLQPPGRWFYLPG